MLTFVITVMYCWVSAGGDLSFKQLMAKGDSATAEFKNDVAIEFYLLAAKRDPSAYEPNLKVLRAYNAKGQQLFYGDNNKEAAYTIFKDNYERAKELYKVFPKKRESPFALAVTAGNLALLSSPREKVLLTLDIEKNLKESVRLDPNFAYGYLGLGIFYKEISRITFLERFFAEMFFGDVPTATLEDAEFYLNKSFKMDPNFIFTRYHLANCLERMKKTPQAIEMYLTVLSSKNSDINDALWKQLTIEALKKLGIDTSLPLESSNTR